MANIDSNFLNLSKEQVIRKYISNINIIRAYSQAQGISDEQFNEIVIKHFDGNLNFFYYHRLTQYIKKRSALIVLLLVCIFILFHKHETVSILLRNIQAFIYPGMKIWRKLTLPIISRYPSLTGRVMKLFKIRTYLIRVYFQNTMMNRVLLIIHFFKY